MISCNCEPKIKHIQDGIKMTHLDNAAKRNKITTQ